MARKSAAGDDAGSAPRPKPKRVRRKCSHAGCQNRVVQGGVCVTHGARRKLCNHPGCDKAVKLAGFCSAHGPARRRCGHDGCERVAVQGGMCLSHGARRRVCRAGGCEKNAIVAGMCKKHHDMARRGLIEVPPPSGGGGSRASLDGEAAAGVVAADVPDVCPVAPKPRAKRQRKQGGRRQKRQRRDDDDEAQGEPAPGRYPIARLGEDPSARSMAPPAPGPPPPSQQPPPHQQHQQVYLQPPAYAPPAPPDGRAAYPPPPPPAYARRPPYPHHPYHQGGHHAPPHPQGPPQPPPHPAAAAPRYAYGPPPPSHRRPPPHPAHRRGLSIFNEMNTVDAIINSGTGGADGAVGRNRDASAPPSSAEGQASRAAADVASSMARLARHPVRTPRTAVHFAAGGGATVHYRQGPPTGAAAPASCRPAVAPPTETPCLGTAECACKNCRSPTLAIFEQMLLASHQLDREDGGGGGAAGSGGGADAGGMVCGRTPRGYYAGLSPPKLRTAAPPAPALVASSSDEPTGGTAGGGVGARTVSDGSFGRDAGGDTLAPPAPERPRHRVPAAAPPADAPASDAKASDLSRTVSRDVESQSPRARMRRRARAAGGSAPSTPVLGDRRGPLGDGTSAPGVVSGHPSDRPGDRDGGESPGSSLLPRPRGEGTFQHLFIPGTI